METQKFYVIDAEDGSTSWSYKTESGECFKTVPAAQKRALELANSEPGKIFFICQAIQCAQAPVERAACKKV